MRRSGPRSDADRSGELIPSPAKELSPSANDPVGRSRVLKGPRPVNRAIDSLAEASSSDGQVTATILAIRSQGFDLRGSPVRAAVRPPALFPGARDPQLPGPPQPLAAGTCAGSTSGLASNVTFKPAGPASGSTRPPPGPPEIAATGRPAEAIGQGRSFDDDYAQPKAADGGPVFWTRSAGQPLTDDAFVQADAPEAF